MHFGSFMEFGTRSGVSHAEAFREGFDHARLCEDTRSLSPIFSDSCRWGLGAMYQTGPHRHGGLCSAVD
jgi:hypothetical protein